MSSDSPTQTARNGGPATEIEIEGQATTAPMATETPYPGQSPYKRFKIWRKSLVVTDFSRLAWCELHLDYSERQQSSRSIEQRLRSFPSARGKTIKVDIEVMKNNDRVTNLGRKIHRGLQLEINPPELKITSRSDVNRWGQRLVAMIDCVRSLSEQGCCREMPVIGIMNGLVVQGLIDHVQRQVIPAEAPVDLNDPAPSVEDTPSGSQLKRKRTSIEAPDADEPKLKKVRIQDRSEATEETEAAPQTSADSSSSCCYELHISDTKTRSEPGMPPESDAIPSRLQLMLYRKLLSGLLAPPSSPDAVNLDAIWTLVRVSPETRLSRTFIQEMKLERYGPSQRGWTLNELVRVFKESVKALHVDKIDNAMSIVYRTQAKTETTAAGEANPAQLTADEKWPIVGTRTVCYDDEVLDEFLRSAFEYWNGERLPKGVEEPLMERRCL
ncbi:hypothetical protein EIP86_004703 [Pleurotus ostreatoroseus]|nr:hypothetical protein EIP86_004703 [Pleurotus ostreatoroseus]